jgi:hypothetical protein
LDRIDEERATDAASARDYLLLERFIVNRLEEFAAILASE